MHILLLLLALSPAHAWPDDTAWIPLTQGGSPLTDPQNDTVGLAAESAWDLVGDTTNPVASWAFDDDNLYFRMRVNADPSDTNPLPYSGSWGIVFNTDSDMTCFEFSYVLGSLANAAYFISNTSSIGGLNDEAETVSFSEPSSTSIVQYQSVGVTSVGVLSDWYIELALSISDLVGVTTWTEITAWTVAVATTRGSDYTTLDSDGAGHDDAGGFGVLSDYLSDPIAIDGDADGLDWYEEATWGTDPEVADTDDDGLSDGDEVLVHGTDPTDPDCDDDNLSDGAEIAAGTDPRLADTDGDGVTDDLEVGCEKGGTTDDRDGDGFTDADEGAVDTDEDGDPDFCDRDSDGDGRADADEGTGDDDCDGIANRVDDDDTDGHCPDDSGDTSPPVDTDDSGDCVDCLGPGHLTGGCSGCGSTGAPRGGLLGLLLAAAALVRRR